MGNVDKKKALSGYKVVRAAPKLPAGNRPDGQAAMRNYDVYAENCPTRLLLDHIADKWTALVLWKISDGPVRFNQLRRDVEGISTKVLSQTLKRLGRDGLIARKVFATVPVTVEYSITPLGNTLAEKLSAITEWAEANIEAVIAAQERFDRECVCADGPEAANGEKRGLIQAAGMR
ncbi:winged helix-turn-helix transcriptional regulator [Mesorhizobium sp. UC22_110]|uniref:winged helix-turn-helix transcriptional regulator n=1 Tax=unclassified Mesorhizobium TaxID=325217 RepID=UPI00366DFB83